MLRLPTAADVLAALFFFNDTPTTEIYTLSLHDALPISAAVMSMLPALAPALVCAARRITSASLSLIRMLPHRPLLLATCVVAVLPIAEIETIPVAAESVVTAAAPAAVMSVVASPASVIA